MSQPASPATEIPVELFRQILIWPLLIHAPHGESAMELMDLVTDELERHSWHWNDRSAGQSASPLKGLPWYQDDHDYSEIVYFHSYVRDFLYGGDGTPASERPLRVLRRTDIASLLLKVDEGREYRLKVERVEAYLFDSGILQVVVEVAAPQLVSKSPTDSEQLRPFMLSDALDLQNVLRMAFPRRWKPKTGIPSETPHRACWLNSEGSEIAGSVQDFLNQEDFTRIVREQAELPAAKHWQYLVQPLPLFERRVCTGLSVKQIEDQRLPSMSYIAVPDPRLISDGDFERIAFFDSAGQSSVGSYSDEFLVGWEKDHAYDRFWQRLPSEGGPEVALHNQMMRTRWLCSGYGFAVVGASGDKFFTTQIAANFRHHYFRMGLIAHFHRAKLISLRDQLAEATKQVGENFRNRVMEIQRSATIFRARFWFHEVSTQLQGREIFTWWSNRLGNPSLFEHVISDIEAAESQVRTEFEAEESQDINLITRVGGAIGILSIVLSIVALIISLLALEAISPLKQFAIMPANPWDWTVANLWLGRIASIACPLSIVSLWILLVVYGGLRYYKSHRRTRRLR
ncbi:hypothetical protein Psta_1139 [Pirellula staleyi DSM 6068]|uniref:Uncharacterized protein n=1 Tax=Pirellula staleyi (strain ATCC 27377 / DSM 6068 / ICPB 4128) TaxID=530564 RepID=D2R8Z4_PIRSD|nr:hypothetical protein [Pirellula staleyi]ADB15821.1 hypothetical protein Psta_1139 [Pirellula staleyi DSM 6068]